MSLGTDQLMQEIQQLNSENDQLRVLLGEKDKTIKLLNQNLERKTYEVGKYSNENAELREAISNFLSLIFISCSK